MGKRRSDAKRRYMAILMALQDSKCFHCGEHMTPCMHRHDGRTSRLEATIEHIIPRAARRADDWKFSVLAHRKCNLQRADATLSRDDITRARMLASEALYIYDKEL